MIQDTQYSLANIFYVINLIAKVHFVILFIILRQILNLRPQFDVCPKGIFADLLILSQMFYSIPLLLVEQIFYN